MRAIASSITRRRVGAWPRGEQVRRAGRRRAAKHRDARCLAARRAGAWPRGEEYLDGKHERLPRSRSAVPDKQPFLCSILVEHAVSLYPPHRTAPCDPRERTSCRSLQLQTHTYCLAQDRQVVQEAAQVRAPTRTACAACLLARALRHRTPPASARHAMAHRAHSMQELLQEQRAHNRVRTSQKRPLLTRASGSTGYSPGSRVCPFGSRVSGVGCYPKV